MDSMTQQSTRIWWNDEEVKFIGWTEKTLVFHWEDPRETAIHMPRGAVVRLMDKGVLRIEGYVPVWMRPAEPPSPAPQVEAATSSANNSKFNVVARLIRKLSGDRSPEKAGAAGEVKTGAAAGSDAARPEAHTAQRAAR
jgi:hypothetical protein